MLPLYPRLPETFKRAAPYLLASICFHEQWLRSTLPAHHPLFNTHLFASGQVATLKAHVTAGRSHCPLTGMSVTGIPPHLVLSNELVDVAKQTEVLKDALLETCSQLPSELVTVILKRFSINGAIPVTLDDFKALLSNAVNQMRAELRDAIPTAAGQSSPLDPLADPTGDPRFQLWQWGKSATHGAGGMAAAGRGCEGDMASMQFGHVEARIRSLRHLKKADLQGGGQVSLWSKTNGVMGSVAEMMVEMKLAEDVGDVRKLTAEQSSAAFDTAIVQLMERVKEGSTRTQGKWMEMSIGTLYNHLKAIRGQRKRKRDEERHSEGEAGETTDARAVRESSSEAV